MTGGAPGGAGLDGVAITLFPWGAWATPSPTRAAADRDASPACLPRVLPWAALAARLTTHRPVPADLPWTCASRAHRPKRWSRPGRCPDCGAELHLDKRSLPAWSPWTFSGPRRSAAGALDCGALVLDYDHGVDVEAARATWAPWGHVGHTTWGHAPGAPRLRVVVPLAARVARDAWPAVWTWACERDPRMDTTIGDPGRLAFLPFARPGARASCAAWTHDGPRLDVEALELPARQANPRPAPVRTSTRDGRALELRSSPDARRALALAVGARLRGEGAEERAVDAPCPACGRRSVWWWMAPRSWSGCGCVHEASCGWTGWLDQIGTGEGT